MSKPDWSPSPQDRYVAYLENELIRERQKTMPMATDYVKVVCVTTGEVLTIKRLHRIADGYLLIEVE